MSMMASQITSVSNVCSTVYSGAYQRKRQSSASLAFVRGIHRSGEIPAQRISNADLMTSSNKTFSMHSRWSLYLLDIQYRFLFVWRHMNAMAAQITGNLTICSTVCPWWSESNGDSHRMPVMWKVSPCHDIIMLMIYIYIHTRFRLVLPQGRALGCTMGYRQCHIYIYIYMYMEPELWLSLYLQIFYHLI